MPYIKEIKNILILILIFTWCLTSIGQNIAISNTKQNIFYLGIDNPFEVVVENMKCGTFIVTTNNGKIKGELCYYMIIPEKTGTATISIKTIKGNDTTILKQKYFRVKNLPKPTAKIAGKNSGSINKKLLAAQTGIIANLENFDIDIHYYIKEFSILIVSKTGTVYFKTIEGAKLTKGIKIKISDLQKDDKIYFIDIIAIGPSQIKEALNTIKLIIE